ncbi:hypothetical protein EYC84_010817 [Monilinia fructicola]|uniref:Uncharacterized protein n=1 Tax=Monilinia fructicola TaxID=38448 RepID=A0A5M9JCV1_MONFR|nr:hypothetical protein EYC84_010817 [Monilinia fructicola]
MSTSFSRAPLQLSHAQRSYPNSRSVLGTNSFNQICQSTNVKECDGGGRKEIQEIRAIEELPQLKST